jgi:hypothetical protein
MRALCITSHDPFHPLRHREVKEIGKRRMIRTLAPKINAPYIATLNGQVILRAEWGRKINDGDLLTFVVLPRGGGGGGGSNPLRIVLSIALMVIAPGIGGMIGNAFGLTGTAFSIAGTAVSWGSIFGFGVSMIGSALINALIPPPKAPSMGGAATSGGYGGQSASPTYNLQAQGNQARLEAAIPVQYGRIISFPDFAAQPYLEYAGNEQYLFQLFCLGAGEYSIESIRIEDTPVANFEEITVQVVAPGVSPTLFPTNVVSASEVSGQELITVNEYIGPFTVNAPATSCYWIGIDLVCPRGLYYANDQGGMSGMSASAQIEARLINDSGSPLGGWVTLGNETISAASSTVIRKSYRYSVANGRYEVRVKRTDSKINTARYGHDLMWAGLRGYLHDALDYGNVTLIAMRARATNNLSSQSARKVNVISTRKLPIWNGTSWSAPTATRSIAWALADAARNADYGASMPDARLDMAGLLALDATWAARGDSFDGRFDNFLPWWEATQKIAGAGRARPFLQGGNLYVVRDQAQTTPVVLFNQRNIVRGSLTIDYLMPTDDTADAVDVSYFDQDVWQPRRALAKLPGSSAAKPAKADMFGVVNRAQAYREGMYQAAANRYRRKLIKFTCEQEGFIPSFGDLVAISHDMPAWGKGGEVIAWDYASSNLTLSEPVTFTDGATHYIGLARANGSVSGPYIVTATAEADVVHLTTPMDMTPYTGGNQERTRFAFGPGETWRQLARVVTIRPRGTETVDIECVNEDPSVHTADVGVTAPPVQSSQLPGTAKAPVVTALYLSAQPGAPLSLIASWPPATGADHYLLEQSGDGGLTWQRTLDTTGTDARAEALAEGSTLVRVAAVGLLRGPWIQASYASAYAEALLRVPAAPAGFAVTLSSSGARLAWAANTETDLSGYELRDGPSWELGTQLYRGNSTELTLPADWSGTRNFYLRAYISTSRGDSFSAISSATVTLSVPSAPTFTGHITGPEVVLDWSPAALTGGQLPVAGYRLYEGATFGGATLIAELTSTTWRAQAAWLGNRTYWLTATDTRGQVGSAAQASIVISAPPAPALSSQIIANNVLLFWEATPGTLPIATFEVRKGATWAGAEIIGQKSGGFTSVMEVAGGEFTYWVAAIDTAGNVGTPQPVATTVAAPADYVLKALVESTFTGSITGGAVDDGGVVLGLDATETWQDHFSTRGWATPQAQIDAGYPIYAQPGTGSGTYEETFDYGATLAASRVTVSYTGEIVAGTPTLACEIAVSANGSSWTTYADSTQIYATAFRYVRVRIAATGAGVLWRLAALSMRLDAQLKTFSGTVAAVAGDSGGTTVYLTDDRTAGGNKVFIDVDSLTITPQGTTSVSAVYDFTDAPNPLSFKVLLFNSTTGARVSGTASFTIRGF